MERLSIKRKISEVVLVPGLLEMGLAVGVLGHCFRNRGGN